MNVHGHGEKLRGDHHHLESPLLSPVESDLSCLVHSLSLLTSPIKPMGVNSDIDGITYTRDVRNCVDHIAHV